MTDKEALRQTALKEADNLGQKRRFGLFSQPISTAIGDDGPYKTKFHPRQDEGKGKPISRPRNFQSGPCRSGQLRKSYLGELNSLAVLKDQYFQEPKRLLKQQNIAFKTGHKNENKYKPASALGSKVLHKAAYEYIEEKRPELDSKRNRQEDGRVKSKARHALSNPGSKVIDSYFKPLKHMDDPYDRAHQLEVEKHKKDKALEGEQAFRPNCFTAKQLNKDQKIYGEDVELKNRTQKQTKFNIFNHENKWKVSNPNKKGLSGYFSPFPVYMENPLREAKRKASQEKKDIFKSMNSTLTTPSSSITGNSINLRKNVSHSFSHRM